MLVAGILILTRLYALTESDVGVLPTHAKEDHLCACDTCPCDKRTHTHTHGGSRRLGPACLPRVSVHLKGLNINGINAVSLPSAIIRHSV